MKSFLTSERAARTLLAGIATLGCAAFALAVSASSQQQAARESPLTASVQCLAPEGSSYGWLFADGSRETTSGRGYDLLGDPAQAVIPQSCEAYVDSKAVPGRIRLALLRGPTGRAVGAEVDDAEHSEDGPGQEIVNNDFEDGTLCGWDLVVGALEPFTCIELEDQSGDFGENVTLFCDATDQAPSFCTIWPGDGAAYDEPDCRVEHTFAVLPGCTLSVAFCQPMAPDGPISQPLEIFFGNCGN